MEMNKKLVFFYNNFVLIKNYYASIKLLSFQGEKLV